MENQNQTNELQKIKDIINDEIRPALQMHGGDVQVIGLEDNVVKINYQGACGGCPGATTATLAMISHILREKYKPDIEVKIA